MTSLNAIADSPRDQQEGLGGLVDVSAIDLLLQLGRVNVIGRQMFERDCLGFSFESWMKIQSGQDVPHFEQVGIADVLSDIADIRALADVHPDEVDAVDHDLLEAIAAIETFVRAHGPTIQ
jgi:hypothetical protein